MLQMIHTVEHPYSAHNWEMAKSMLYQSIHYNEVPYNFTLNLNNSRHTTYITLTHN